MKKHYNHAQHPRSGVGLAVTDQRALCWHKLMEEQCENSLCKCVVVKSAVSKIWTSCLLP